MALPMHNCYFISYYSKASPLWSLSLSFFFFPSFNWIVLKLQYFGHLRWRVNSLENILMLGKIEGRRGWQRKDWRQKEKRTTDKKIVGWHHRLSELEFEQTPGEGQRSLACYSPWGHKDSDTAEWLNNNSSVH